MKKLTSGLQGTFERGPEEQPWYNSGVFCKEVLQRKLKVSGDMILVVLPSKYLEWVGGNALE